MNKSVPPKHRLQTLERAFLVWNDSREYSDLGQFLEQANEYIFRLALRLLGQREDAEDISQNVLMKLSSRVQGETSEIREFEAWIYTLTLNEIRNYIRSNSKRRERERVKGTLDEKLKKEADGSMHVAGQVAPPLVDEITEVRDAVWEALDDLPLELREPLVLHYSDALAKTRVAELLEVPESTIRERLVRGLNQLRQLLLLRNVGPSAVAMSWFLKMLPEKYDSGPGLGDH